MKNQSNSLKGKLGIAATLALVTLAISSGSGFEQGNGVSPTIGYATPPNDFFAQRITGSYLVDFPDGSRLLLALDSGGATHRESSDDFLGLTGLPDLPFYFYGGGFGNWTRTGLHTIRIVELAFQFGADGSVSAISKVTIDLDFNVTSASANGRAVVTIYSPSQDPITEEPLLPGPTFEVQLRRIR